MLKHPGSLMLSCCLGRMCTTGDDYKGELVDVPTLCGLARKTVKKFQPKSKSVFEPFSFKMTPEGEDTKEDTFDDSIDADEWVENKLASLTLEESLGYVLPFGKFKGDTLAMVCDSKRGRNYLHYLLSWKSLRRVTKACIQMVLAEFMKQVTAYHQQALMRPPPTPTSSPSSKNKRHKRHRKRPSAWS